MPIKRKEHDHRPLCIRGTWSIVDQGRLAKLVAQLVLGRYLHVQRILQTGSQVSQITGPEAAINLAIKRLKKPKNDPDRWHRDGWVFQFISWIVTELTVSAEAASSIPHMQPTRQGLDGVIVVLSSSQDQVSGVIICEDKATDCCRDTIRDDVWPFFAECEAGDRDAELLSEVTAILERHGSPSVERLIEAIHWEERRQYRIAITTKKFHEGDQGTKRLFKGYDLVVPGPPERRRAETILRKDIRQWMDDFCQLVVAELESMR